MPDRNDLRLHGLVEDPALWEAAIRAEIARGRTDEAARRMIESIYCDEDRAAAFDRYERSREFQTLLRVVDALRLPRAAAVCELGGGGGWLGWALHGARFPHLDMVEPNDNWISGTGYLRSRPDAAKIKTYNELDAWYADDKVYDLIVTHNCVHHFTALPYVAACIRTKLREGARWLMVREWFADTPDEVYARLREHPYSQKYGLFEFPYPASYYVDSLRLVGFRLDFVVPAGYADDVLLDSVIRDYGWKGRIMTRAVDAALRGSPTLLAKMFDLEVFANKYLGATRRRFSRPQALAFTCYRV